VQLSDESRASLDRREPTVELPEQDVTAVHGSPRHPIWEYILDARTAMENFSQFTTRTCFYGHTHVPVIYQEEVDGALRRPIDPVNSLVPDGTRWLVNPGSVGQPRDGDPRASYLRFDPASGAVTFHRVMYDIRAVQHKIHAAKLPHRLAARLDYGW